MRAWLYRIATNACLDALEKRPRRVLPHDVLPPADPHGPPPQVEGDFAWLEPYPDDLLEGVAAAGDDPTAAFEDKETMELAFLAAIQHLPPKQRAVLILRDVVAWSANETADLLDESVVAVKSALQRARATLKRRVPARREEWGPTSPPSHEERAVLQRYMEALEADDNGPLAAVLAEDVRVLNPPIALWADGRDDFITGSSMYAPPGEFRAVAARANLQPAVALYLRSPGDSEFRLITLEVLRIEGGQVKEIVDYGQPELLAAFGLAPTL